MFTRIVECQAKKGRTDVLAKKVRNEVLPTLQKQPGFIDLVVLRDTRTMNESFASVSGNRGRALSFTNVSTTTPSSRC